MKKILYIASAVLLFASCRDFNEDNFPGYGDAESSTNVITKEITMSNADYSTIVSGLRAKKNAKDSLTATKLNTAKKFSSDLSAADLIPYLLNANYYAADIKSSIKVTYSYDSSRDSTVAGLSGAGYVFADADYKQVWGDTYVTALTPSKAPATYIPTILKNAFPSAAEGTYKVVEYAYSPNEPTSSTVSKTIVSETFDSYAANATLNQNGWITKAVKGAKLWTAGIYNANGYAQTSSFGSGEVNDIWLVTPQADLTSSSNPKLSFDVQISYWVGDVLSVLVSTDFDGKEEDLASATWTDITSSFSIPQTAGGWGTSSLATAGTASLTSYKGKKVYVAFRYVGDAPNKLTTNVRLENILLSDQVTGLSVASKSTAYAAYKYSSAKWQAVDNSIYVLQPIDYSTMSFSSNILTTAQAPNYLPIFCRENYKYAQIGDQKVIVYRTAANTFYADRLVKASDGWSIKSFVENKTDQFVRASVNGNKSWIYDPTIILGITKSDYQLVVDHVKEVESINNAGALDSRGNAEFYYGFSAYYGNVSYREVDRIKDNTYPTSSTTDEKVTFLNQRTIEGLAILLAAKYPNAAPTVNGVDQYARITGIQIYADPTPGAATRSYYTYTMQCTGDKTWKYVSRELTAN